MSVDYLTTLPVELIHKILDNVSSLDILLSVCFVNKRLRLISLTYPRFRLNFTCMDTLMSKSQFDSICTQLLYMTSQVVSLTLFNENDRMTYVKNPLFFSRFNIVDRTFPNLRSLTLTYIDFDTWNIFKTRFPPFIVTFSIYLCYSGILSSLPTTTATLSELLFLSPSLQYLSVKMAGFSDGDVKIRPPNSAITSSVQYFYLKYITIDLFSLLAIAPMLHTLEGRFKTRDLKLGRIYPRLLYLQQLRIELWTITWTEMVTLLSSFPQLAYLIVIADYVNSDMTDGFAWIRLLQQIKHFEFKLKFSYNAFEQQSLNLDSFRTNFWLEEKKWFVTFDQSSSTNDSSILYTNSSSIIEYPPHEIFGILISQTTASEPTSFSHVGRLIIDDHYLQYPFFHRYTHIKELYFSEVTSAVATTFKDLATRLNTSQITTCHVGPEWIRNTSHEHIDFLHDLRRLRELEISSGNISCFFPYKWPHIVHLTIGSDDENELHVLCSNDIDVICHSFPHIERLNIHSSCITDLPQLINRMKMSLTDIIIRQPRNVNDEQCITREWIKRNTELRNFHYICTDWNCVKLWL